MTEQKLVSSFVDQVIQNSDYTDEDRIYLTNQVLSMVGDSALTATTVKSSLIDLKDDLVDVAAANGRIDNQGSKDILGARLMDLMTPAPSVINRRFWDKYVSDPQKALRYFYQLSQQNDYIKTKAIAQNIVWSTPTDYGEIEITINLSKPEKDPKQIAAAKKAKDTGYPRCAPCIENEGYAGRVNYPARTNHRVIRFKLGDQQWGFQYSPYAYFNEHCIFLASQHRPMVINRTTFQQLLSIIQQFPGYFVGSNADLPIVGGSILSYEHYQGGRHQFPMEKSPIATPLTFKGFEDVTAGIVQWPMSVIRLRSSQEQPLVELANKILNCWRHYSDESVDVRVETAGVPHHTITPIARKRNGQLELDLVLRDNQTSAKYPDGIFHPHKDVQHIKKENIGLIEVMGWAILPPRLKPELREVEKFLLGQPNEMADYHRPWAEQLKEQHPQINADNVSDIVKNAVGNVFARVLEDAGAYKRTDEGQQAFMRFVDDVNNH
ncbi:MAG TPA: UDP-glucose--hexose-1-phosphate uridylyltransferase [Candidatus Limosilactobacillus merdipullorum]|uniref:Galactose-1-phosphate uridylyltransferase n=1 Tax=Candidatus Limosilactobacillus merdipullorum TaxID=2838653 RepID=A0A9D1QP66_9LACO|nr:UDP-glucose--hexose-1-phosphate uridylyltransferase [Candidatus Limosilactobacillus merdipullorum]